MSECFEKSHCIQTCVWRQFSVVLHAPVGQWSFHPPDPQSPPGPSTEHRAAAMCCVPSSTPSSSWGRAWTCREQDLHMLHANDRGTTYHTSSLYTFIAEIILSLSLISGSCQFLRLLQNIIVKFLRLGFLSWPLTSDLLLTTECCIAENFWGRKLSRILRFCGYTWKFSPWNWGVAFFSAAKVSNPRKLYFTNLRKFSPSKVSRYTVFTRKVINPWVHHTLQCFGPKGLSLNNYTIREHTMNLLIKQLSNLPSQHCIHCTQKQWICCVCEVVGGGGGRLGVSL